MPKKFSNAEHPKAVAARERKTTSQEVQTAQKQLQEENSYWQDDDKLTKRKQQRKEDQMAKHQQYLAKKAENKMLLEQEMKVLKSGKPQKVTRAQIGAFSKSERTNEKCKLLENLNRIKVDEVTARSVEEALSFFNGKVEDKHPEKRRRAAFSVFENRRMKELRSENPQLKFSQLKEIVFKEWQKSPENPMNEKNLMADNENC